MSERENVEGLRVLPSACQAILCPLFGLTQPLYPFKILATPENLAFASLIQYAVQVVGVFWAEIWDKLEQM